MSSARLVFSSSPAGRAAGVRPLSALGPGTRGTVRDVRPHGSDCVARLVALGVTVSAPVTVLQSFPGVVFLCDQTELVVERAVAEMILVELVDA